VTLQRGQVYYIAFTASSATARVTLQNPTGVSTVLSHGWNLRGTQASALPLPASATPTWDGSSLTPCPVVLLI
jgi:hypothetical protein